VKSSVHTRMQTGIAAAFASPAQVRSRLGTLSVPTDIAAWLGRLHTLIGVPFPYLVPDEGMLPPESIRFFRLDPAWVAALLDGAFSLGRNLTAAAGPSANLDAAVLPDIAGASRAAAPRRKRRAAQAHALAAIGTPQPVGAAAAQPWNGFVLRSKVVSDYPGLGVNVYPKGHTPDDPGAPLLLPVRRLDRLGEQSDTLFCLVEGEPYQVDLHEAPEALHYGIDSYMPATDGAPSATKVLMKFTTTDGRITLLGKTDPLPIGDAFRSTSRRVLKLAEIAALVAKTNGRTAVNAADIGFEMTEGVGKVSFINRGPA